MISGQSAAQQSDGPVACPCLPAVCSEPSGCWAPVAGAGSAPRPEQTGARAPHGMQLTQQASSCPNADSAAFSLLAGFVVLGEPGRADLPSVLATCLGLGPCQFPGRGRDSLQRTDAGAHLTVGSRGAPVRGGSAERCCMRRYCGQRSACGGRSERAVQRGSAGEQCTVPGHAHRAALIRCHPGRKLH